MSGPRAIVGTAGHIDHGKSALVRALTGIETDRLKEERERGISIELGFAHLDLPDLGRVGIVDVPGHERFIRQMLAGAHGFDLVLVVVAADDGVMPQTEEHFDIVHLLGVRRALFVISKIDAVSHARVEDVRGEIEILAVGTRFEDAPVVAVSARSGAGIEELRAAIAAALTDLEPRSDEGVLRIPVDRVFVMKGHGVVISGTALGGRVSVGDEVLVLPDVADKPAGRRARVREIQVHSQSVETARAGERVALNLAGLGKDDIARGDTIAKATTAKITNAKITAPGATVTGAGVDVPPVTTRLDARVEVRPAAGRALASHVRVRVHHGTRETMARLVWLDGVAEVAPRQSALAQLSLAEPLVALVGDRFVLRDETAKTTLGGGVVLLAQAQRHRRSQGDVVPRLQKLEDQDDAKRLYGLLDMAPEPALDPAAAAQSAGLSLEAAIALATSESGIVALPDSKAPQLLAAQSRLEASLGAIGAAVAEYLSANANLPGVDVEHLRGAVRPVLDAKVFRHFVDRLLADGTLLRRGNLLYPPGHAASLGGADDAVATRLLALVRGAGMMPPLVKDLATELRVDAARVLKVAGVLVVREDLVKVAPDLFYDRAVLGDIAAQLEARLRADGEITAAGFRDLIAASRKYVIPLLDWFDRSGLTIRVGDTRKLRRA